MSLNLSEMSDAELDAWTAKMDAELAAQQASWAKKCAEEAAKQLSLAMPHTDKWNTLAHAAYVAGPLNKNPSIDQMPKVEAARKVLLDFIAKTEAFAFCETGRSRIKVDGKPASNLALLNSLHWSGKLWDDAWWRHNGLRHQDRDLLLTIFKDALAELDAFETSVS